MELENKEFKIETSSLNENLMDIINKQDFAGWWFDKDQLDALINILNQLKEEIDGSI